MNKIIKLLLVSFLALVFIGIFKNADAASTYSKTATAKVIVYTATYKTSEKATYHISGDTRWSYSNHSASYVSGALGKGVSWASPYTSNHYKKGDVQYTYRTTKFTLTDSDYKQHTGNAVRSWKFDTSKKSFK